MPRVAQSRTAADIRLLTAARNARKIVCMNLLAGLIKCLGGTVSCVLNPHFLFLFP